MSVRFSRISHRGKEKNAVLLLEDTEKVNLKFLSGFFFSTVFRFSPPFERNRGIQLRCRRPVNS